MKTAKVQIAGEWTRTCHVENVPAFFGTVLNITSDEVGFIYDAYKSYLVRANGEEIPYGTYNIDWQ